MTSKKNAKILITLACSFGPNESYLLERDSRGSLLAPEELRHLTQVCSMFWLQTQDQKGKRIA